MMTVFRARFRPAAREAACQWIPAREGENEMTSLVDARNAALAAFVFLTMAPAAPRAADAPAPPLEPMALVDCTRPASFRVRDDGAGTTHAITNDGRSLIVSTRATEGYPGVVLEPASGPWNLKGYDGVALDVRNPNNSALRVLFSVNNPGADGRNHCNTEAVELAPRGKATLRLPFGSWHGEPNHPLDLASIVSVAVFLEQPATPRRFIVDGIRAISFATTALDEARDNPFFQRMDLPFRRGVNLGNALEAPKEGDWGVTLTAQHFALIRSAGFDSVRIPVRWSAHADEKPPYRIDPAFFERVDWVIRQCRERNLLAVLNMHHYDDLTADPDAHRSRFLAMWDQIATHYRSQPNALAFELLNEPHGALTSDKWNALLAEAITVVRRTNPGRRIVVGPVGWNGIGALSSLALPEEDRNLVVTVHYYNPFAFTHQGAAWAGNDADKWLGTKWTGSPEEKAAVSRDLDTALRWALENRRPIYLGEFGAYSRADMDSRARWTQYVAEQASLRKMAWAYWEFCSGFGVYDPERGAWNEPLKRALLPPGGRAFSPPGA